MQRPGGDLRQRCGHCRAPRLALLCLLVAACLLAVGDALAQPRSEAEQRARAERFREQVVRVLTETTSGSPGEPGFGIIVGEANGLLYIATPYHVAFGRDPRSVQVRDTPGVLFYTAPNARPSPGRRLDSAASPQGNDDLAVLEVSPPAGFNAPHIPLAPVDRFVIGAYVWNIGIGTEWELPYRAGGLGEIDVVTRWRRVGALRAPGGSSGGAAVTEDGIVGMVERDGEAYSLVLPIERIVELFRAWRLPVNLVGTAPAPAQAIITPPTPNPQPAVVAPSPATRHPGERFRDCPTCPEMVVIPAGTFLMGSPPDEEDRGGNEGPQQRITIAPFAAGRFEVTFAEWDACAAGGGCGGYRPADQGWGRGDRPVINVSWQDAQSYVTWLSTQTRQRYRLLTEAEWEYAARAGTVTPFSTGGQITPDQAQYDWRSFYAGSPTRATYDAKTAPAGRFPANGFGLYDMHGNVWEWVQDCNRDGLAGQPPHGEAYGSANCSYRVQRGGSWKGTPRTLRSANRAKGTPGERTDNVGFRVARTL